MMHVLYLREKTTKTERKEEFRALSSCFDGFLMKFSLDDNFGRSCPNDKIECCEKLGSPKK